MTGTLMSRTAVALMALVVAGGVALAFLIQYIRREPPADISAATPSPAIAKPAAGVGNPGPAALTAVQAEAGAVVAALAGSPAAADSGDGKPTFDIARIEPTGDVVIAGRAAPGATVELLRNGQPHDRAVADPSGQFAMVPPRLPAGTYDLTLRTRRPDGTQVTSTQSVAVALEPNASERPVVALVTPDKPTVVLSQPNAPKPVAGTIVVEAVERGPDGKVHVSGRARPGGTARFYLNDSFVASATAGADGRFSITINEGVAPGSYRVRLDEVEPSSGAVRARAEVPFSVPETAAAVAAAPVQAAAASAPDVATAQPLQPAAVAATAVPNAGTPSAVVVPKITTTVVARGDSLWRISQSTYGAGTRYAVIYQANVAQIRDPDLIYPGQIFVLPTR